MNAKNARVFAMVIVMIAGTYISTTNLAALILPSISGIDTIHTRGFILTIITVSIGISIMLLVTGLYMFGNEQTSIRVGNFHLLALYGIPIIIIGVQGMRFPETIAMMLSGSPMIIIGILLISSDLLMKVKDKR